MEASSFMKYNKILLPANGPRQLHYVQEQNRVLKKQSDIYNIFIYISFHFISITVRFILVEGTDTTLWYLYSVKNMD